ncbi:beta-ketoacyl-ACP synthase III [Algisphaera agarilytica]|uniref:Beta-ketoacyl-[acyl-carrier-protein] synthase III n=1 Tax=Algisphaera agarilytica TaxID=1385975 RepID=A0A7X0LJ81_9BACT|nr:beta-ketoacyl-ACP synthase III [Algisphaera agarilytica]MBB6428567.1 3-oxoacyl-[acyl-carrier-protein] synthase-3 [Algisphaera agarilytica]
MTERGKPRAKGVAIVGTGVSLPDKVLTNDDLAKIVDTNDEWITQRTGIKTRRIVDSDTNVRDLARDALQSALDDAKLPATELDLVILATITPEMVCPNTAARVVAELGAAPAGAMDLSAACSGFVYALNVASSLIETGQYKTIGVVGAETLSKIVDYEDRRTCILFGDGAGAAVVTAVDDPTRGCLHQSMHSNGNLWGELYVPEQDAHLPENNTFTGAFNTLQMNGREVYKFAVTTTSKMMQQTLDAAGVKAEDLALVVSHQSNKRILESARDRFGLPEDKLYINIDRFGNTSAASAPICLHEAYEQGKIKEGDLVLFCAIGGGMTWTTSLWRM